MKKYLIYLIPGLLMLNACNEGRQGFSADQAAVVENSLVSGSEESRNDEATTAKAPQVDGSGLPEAPPAQPAPPSDDGSHTVDVDAVPGHGPVTLTPAFPSSGGNGGNDNSLQPVGPGFHFEQANQTSQVQGIQDDNTNLAANASDQGSGSGSGSDVQAVGSRPQVSETNKTLVYDPFCNCYKTNAPGYNESGYVKTAEIPEAGVATKPTYSGTSDEDDDD